MNKLVKIALLVVLGIFLFSASWAQDKPNKLAGVEFLTGFGMANLHAQGDYRLVPVFIDFDFNLKPLAEKKGINFPGLLQFVDEPFVSYAFEPRNNAEIGNNFILKIGIFPETSKFQPYVMGGLGLIYLTQHYHAQSTQFNFNECLGLGLHYFFRKNLGVTLEYRYRHISNAGIKTPNHGIATNFALCGISYLF